jgi:NDP-sugar pyrophosphorylase family protein
MKAMILAAGLGTRLRPLTNDTPKALVEIDGRTLLEITLGRLRKFGVDQVIVNVHHFAEKLAGYLHANNNFGMRIEISQEDVLLDTGGGLKKAAPFFLRDSAGGPLILHNVDVLSNIDLGRLLQFHREHGALATLAVQDRPSSRYLLFNENAELCGRRITKTADGSMKVVRPCPHPQALAFSGIHVISLRMLPLLSESGTFSIIDAYLRLAGSGERILAFRADEYYWRDLGKPENITQASEDISHGHISLA